MATLKIMKAEVTYQCPAWEFCNEMLHGGLTTGNKTCRFCVKQRGTCYCALHDKTLNVHADGTVDKCKDCLGVTKGLFKPKVHVVNAVDTKPDVNPKDIVKAAADQMQKATKQLMNDGYTAELALKMAHDLVAKGGW